MDQAAAPSGSYLRAPAAASVTVLSGSVPADAAGWMSDLSVPGGNDHDFYIDTVVGPRRRVPLDH